MLGLFLATVRNATPLKTAASDWNLYFLPEWGPGFWRPCTSTGAGRLYRRCGWACLALQCLSLLSPLPWGSFAVSSPWNPSCTPRRVSVPVASSPRSRVKAEGPVQRSARAEADKGSCHQPVVPSRRSYLTPSRPGFTDFSHFEPLTPPLGARKDPLFLRWLCSFIYETSHRRTENKLFERDTLLQNWLSLDIARKLPDPPPRGRSRTLGLCGFQNMEMASGRLEDSG